MNDGEPPPSSPRTAVLKIGGEVVADAASLGPLLAQVRTLTGQGWRFVLVHGAGPQAGAMQERLGLRPIKLAGRRVTDDATLAVVKQVLAGEVSLDLVAAALAAGLDAIGLSGVGGHLVKARRYRPVLEDLDPTAPDIGGADFGFVGEVDSIRADLLEQLWVLGLTPVLAPVGVEVQDDGRRQVLNINADTVAAAVAAALQVDHLFLVTSVPGVLRRLDDPTSRIARLAAGEARAAMVDGVICGGMIPKVQDALEQLGAGCIGAVHILASQPGALAAEAARPGSVGTVLLPDEQCRPVGEPDAAADAAPAPSESAR